MTRRAERAGEWVYRLSQGARSAWYFGHYLAAQRLYQSRHPQTATNASRASAASRKAVGEAQSALLKKDWDNISRGIYRLPQDTVPPVKDWVAGSVRFFQDLPASHRRRSEKNFRQAEPPKPNGLYPKYYLQNFHYQTDGWLSEQSAQLYDFQVETVFAGTADAMRRQALVPIAGALEGRDQRKAKLLDVASGTGRFLRDVKQNYPRLDVSALDLSQHYLDAARRALASFRAVDFVHANAEHMPFDDDSFDIVSCIYLFHELPTQVRHRVAAQMARVLKPGGLLVFMDSLQLNDSPALDGLLQRFPSNFHEPYYSSYISADLPSVFQQAGFECRKTELAFLSKLMVLEKVPT